jgi:hypothetical protein
MAFLRLFRRALVVSKDLVLLVDEARTPDRDEPTAPPAEEEQESKEDEPPAPA